MKNNFLNRQTTLLGIGLLAFCGGAVYKLYSLNTFGVIISLILTALSFYIIHYFWGRGNQKNQTEKSEYFRGKYSCIILYLLLFLASILTLFFCRSGGSLISPWQVVPPYFFIIYFLATLTLIVFLYKQKRFSVLIILHYFLSFSVVMIVYKIGYGFDSFIHQATVNLIDKTGQVDPKTLYYLGQYAIVEIIHKITFIPVAIFDKLLIPLLTSIYLPLAIWKFLETNIKQRGSSLVILLALILPFSFFIVTTPQNLAYLFLILAVMLGLSAERKIDFVEIAVLALAATFTQPIAGLPALLFVIALFLFKSKKISFKNYLYSVIFIIAAVILPLAFYLFNRQAGKTGLKEIILNANVNFGIPAQENFLLNFIYLYIFNASIILSVLALAGLYLSWKKKILPAYFISLGMSVSLLISYFISLKIPYNFLIDYERGNYSSRLLTVAAIFLLPFMVIAINFLAERIPKQNKFIQYSFLLLLAGLVSISLYSSYPRFDNYFNSRGYSVSESDINAVRWIAGDAKKDYIVLANQQVSAAALREFGFSKYYKGDLFYYPIPTSSPMYDYYLSMVYEKPSKQTMIKAMDLAGVNESYFVLNRYWWAFSKILDEAKLEANSWQKLDNGEVIVFKYTK